MRIRWASYGYSGAGCEIATMSSMFPTTTNRFCSPALDLRGAEQSTAVVAAARILTREGLNISIDSWRDEADEFSTAFIGYQREGFNGGDLTTRESNSNSIVAHAKIRSFETGKWMHGSAGNVGNASNAVFGRLSRRCLR